MSAKLADSSNNKLGDISIRSRLTSRIQPRVNSAILHQDGDNEEQSVLGHDLHEIEH